MEKKVMPIKEALNLGYLENRKVYLKAVLNNSGNKYDEDKNHVAFWRYEGTSLTYELPQLIGIKEVVFPMGDDQQAFFEVYMSKNLNVDDINSYWFKAEGKVRVYKDQVLFNQGIEFDLSKPTDYLKYKVLQACSTNYINRNICPIGEEPLPQKDVLRLVDDGIDQKKAVDEVERFKTVYMFLGGISTNEEKLREFMNIMANERADSREIPENWVSAKLLKEAMSLIDNAQYRDLAYQLISDKENYVIRVLLYNAMKAGAIDKLGKNSYRISWIGQELGYKLMVEEIKQMKHLQDSDYIKLNERIDAWRKKQELKAKGVVEEENKKAGRPPKVNG
jgi:hypothetical protein